MVQENTESKSGLNLFFSGPIGLICLMGLIIAACGLAWLFLVGFPSLGAEGAKIIGGVP